MKKKFANDFTLKCIETHANDFLGTQNLNLNSQNKISADKANVRTNNEYLKLILN